MKVICARCSEAMKPHRNAVPAIEIASFGPYKLWSADLYACPTCGTEVVTGFAEHAYAVHHEPDFASKLLKAEADPDAVQF